ILRGICMGLNFIPFTTISFVELEGKEVPQGSALSNMIRQLGGSFGIAIMTTFISTRTMFHKAMLSDHVSIYNSATRERLKGMTGLFMSKGDNFAAATTKAIGALTGMVFRQAMII